MDASRQANVQGLTLDIDPADASGPAEYDRDMATTEAAAVGREDVLAAAARIRGSLHRTPTFSARTLGPDVHLKAELFQRTGSFKPRGVLNRLAALTDDERRRGVIGISAGNHAQALAWGAASQGIDALVVMWQGASEAKIAATRGYGAAVDLEATDPADAFRRLETLIAETGRMLVHPFDDPAVIAGQGTVAVELVEDAPDVETILVPGGGGGLVAGIAAAQTGRRVVCVEPEGSRAVHEGLAAGRSVPVTPVSVADGLSAPFAGENALATLRAHDAESLLVSEGAIEEGFRWLYARAKLACEPAAAVGLAPLLTGQVETRRTAVVVSGGNVAGETAAAILARA
jgi:threonine dehydratase